MPEHTPEEKEKNRRNKSANAIAALDASEQSKKPSKPAKPAANAPTEKIGVGRDLSSDTNAALRKQLDTKIRIAIGRGNIDLAEKLRARKKALAEAK